MNQDQTLLTTIVSLDPMYIYFDMDESTRLRILQLIAEGKITQSADGDVRVAFGLENEATNFRTRRQSTSSTTK